MVQHNKVFFHNVHTIERTELGHTKPQGVQLKHLILASDGKTLGLITI